MIPASFVYDLFTFFQHVFELLVSSLMEKGANMASEINPWAELFSRTGSKSEFGKDPRVYFFQASIFLRIHLRSAHTRRPAYTLRLYLLLYPSLETQHCRPYLIEIPGGGDPRDPKGTHGIEWEPRGDQGVLGPKGPR